MHRRILVTGGSGFIGSNLIDKIIPLEHCMVLNVDVQPPSDKLPQTDFKRVDLLDEQSVLQTFQEFQPTEVVHLAGRTDMLGTTVDDYAANHVGTKHVINAVKATLSVARTVFTSSQFVVGPGSLPKDEFDFRPHTIYGQSKVLSELAIRDVSLDCIWTIIRPTNIWGPRHPRYPNEFWRVLRNGRYLHPGGRRVTRCYGYVGNVAEQILRILSAEPKDVDRKVFYVGDAPIDLFDWTNAFSLELTGKPVRIIPRQALRGMALVGDVIVACGGKFPIFSSRFHSMTEDYLTPMEATFAALGPSPISMKEGVRETVSWLRQESSFW